MRECNQKSPRQKCKRDRLIVVLAFDYGADGELVPVFGPAVQQRTEAAVRVANTPSRENAGVVVCGSRASI